MALKRSKLTHHAAVFLFDLIIIDIAVNDEVVQELRRNLILDRLNIHFHIQSFCLCQCCHFVPVQTSAQYGKLILACIQLYRQISFKIFQDYFCR